MKILATADLHFAYNNSKTLKQLKRIVSKEKPDVLVIAGDVYDYRDINPYNELSEFNIPVVFCLGNHEFAYRNQTITKIIYSDNDTSNVFCLDVCGHVDINGVRFVGNVLWYDGSLSERWDVEAKLSNIDDSWLDSTIGNFNPTKENKACIIQIKENLKDCTIPTMLVTHTVPYFKLNQFCFTMPMGVYNIYSGVKDLFGNDDIYVDMAVCGHTHREAKVVYKHKDGRETFCWNVGNNYFEGSGEIKYQLIEI